MWVLRQLRCPVFVGRAVLAGLSVLSWGKSEGFLLSLELLRVILEDPKGLKEKGWDPRGRGWVGGGVYGDDLLLTPVTLGGHPQVAFSHDHHETQCDLFLPFQSSFLFTSLFRFVSLCHFSNSCAYCYFTRMFVCLRRMTYVQFDTGRLFSHSSAARGKFYLKSQTHVSDDGELWCDRRFGDFFSRRHILSSFPKVFLSKLLKWTTAYS